MSSLVSGEEKYFDEASMTPEEIRRLLNDKAKSSDSKASVMEKTQGMKYLIAQMSKGSDVSHFYADVVRNVRIKSVELKKLVYMYLVHHADANSTCRELALLAINSFQKDMSDSNPLIRGLALRVLCSIRVGEIVPIQMIALKKASSDSSAYVRKVASHCLSKVLAVDPTQKDDIIDLIDHLLHDKTVMVLGSTLAAFEEVCPDRLDLLHGVYRRLCQVIPDMDDWAQVTVINLLTRYARTQFKDPSKETDAEVEQRQQKRRSSKKSRKKKKSGFYSDESGDSSDDEDEHEMYSSASSALEKLDPDHKALIEAALPLLRSRNSAVVSSVANMYFYIGPKDRTLSNRVGQALLRHSRGHREVEYFMLKNIAAIAHDRPDIFQKHLKEFFAPDSEPPFVRRMKVDIMSSIVTEKNASLVLTEFSHYVKDDDKDFVRHTIKAVGRVANKLPSVADRCLKGLMGLLTTSDGGVVAEAILVLRQLLQQDTRHGSILVRIGRMLTKVSEPSAKAAIVWIIGEFQSKPQVAKLAPDSLRILAQSFRKEEAPVKLQAVNLAAKLALREDASKVQKNLCYYVLELAKYDKDYDIRDRTRLLRALLARVRAEEKASKQSEPSTSNANAERANGVVGTEENATPSEQSPENEGQAQENEHAAEGEQDEVTAAPEGQSQEQQKVAEENTKEKQGKLSTGKKSEKDRALQILYTSKPPPQVEASSGTQSGLFLGSLSFVLGHPIRGYRPIPDWTTTPTDPSTREPQERKVKTSGRPKKKHHHEEEEEEESESEEGEGEEESESDEEGSSSGSGSDDDDDEGSSSDKGSSDSDKGKAVVQQGEGSESSSDDDDDDDDDDEDDDDEESS